MTQDFANSQRKPRPASKSAPKSAPKPKAKPKTGKPQSTPRFEMAPWLVLLTGVVTGLFIALLIYLAYSGPLQNPTELIDFANQSVTKNAPETPNTDSSLATRNQTSNNKPRFDFYTLLPELEVVVPQMPDPKPRRSAERRNQEVPDHSTYVLQTGSFRNPKDADQLRASLIIQGLDVKIQTVNLESGETWHRVQVGPFNNEKKLHKAEDKLAAAGIDNLRLKLKK